YKNTHIYTPKDTHTPLVACPSEIADRKKRICAILAKVLKAGFREIEVHFLSSPEVSREVVSPWTVLCASGAFRSGWLPFPETSAWCQFLDQAIDHGVGLAAGTGGGQPGFTSKHVAKKRRFVNALTWPRSAGDGHRLIEAGGNRDPRAIVFEKHL